MTTDAVVLPERLKQALDEVVRGIVLVADPQVVFLFGSHAEGRAHGHSDLDLLVVAETDDWRGLTGLLYEVVAGVRRGRWHEVPPFDVVVFTPKQWEHDKHLPGMLAFGVRRHGVVVHGRAA